MQNLPAELKALRQWCCSTATDKSPRQPNGHPAESNNPATWNTYDACEAAMGSHGITRIGFVLAASDPYTIIDLDPVKGPDKLPLPYDHPDQVIMRGNHERMLAYFDSYTELSSSGQGYHIIIRGKKPPNTKSRKNGIEVYDQLRYMICTGNVVNGNGIVDHQDGLNELCIKVLGKASPDIFDIPDGEEVMNDSSVMEMLDSFKDPHRRQKYIDLCNGQWEPYFKSASEADASLIQLFADLSPCNLQVERLFALSGLGQRARMQKRFDYLFRKALAWARTRLAENDAQRLAAAVSSPIPLSSPPAIAKANGHHVETASGFLFPPGLVGEIAQYVYDSSYLQAEPIALAGALTLMAGVCGRSYNFIGSGLNQYMVLLAKTGRGKEGAREGINRLMNKVRVTVPGALDFQGPSGFASGQGLIKRLAKTPSVYSFLGEFGHLLEILGSKRLNSAEIHLKQAILDLFNLSGEDGYAAGIAYSDQEKSKEDRGEVLRPALTFLGDTTPEKFFEVLENSQITEGFIPRLTIIEHRGIVPEENANYKMPPSPQLIDRVKTVVLGALASNQNGSICNVQADDGGLATLKAYRREITRNLNEGDGPENEIWNRAHQRAQRLAGLIAVGVNPMTPVVTSAEAKWAVDFIQGGMGAVLAHFRHGEVGQGDSAQMKRVMSLVNKFLDDALSKSWERGKFPAMKARGWVPREWLQTNTSISAAFKNDRLGATAALDRCVKELESQGKLALVDPKAIMDAGFGGKAWARK